MSTFKSRWLSYAPEDEKPSDTSKKTACKTCKSPLPEGQATEAASRRNVEDPKDFGGCQSLQLLYERNQRIHIELYEVLRARVEAGAWPIPNADRLHIFFHLADLGDAGARAHIDEYLEHPQVREALEAASQVENLEGLQA